MKKVILSNHENELELMFTTFEKYEDFDFLLEYLKQYQKAKVFDIVNDFDIRSAYVRIESSTLRLYRDPYSTSLYGSFNDRLILQKIHDDVVQRLSQDYLKE